ncbi:family 18 putative glycoside hydrolase [Triangularia verruculosa]|uniref:chitinase n=1 Tax=Triangularia verruculosa TaxID=2587418 RepID=A0AAN6X954_9PEZI|nr:family 18 putative glycoside hydrolase [Triangularia verruculosa]
MRFSSCQLAGLGLVGHLLSTHVAAIGFEPPLRTVNHAPLCPERCGLSGANSGNWSAYPSFTPIRSCQETMFYDFSLYDPVDDPSINHRIQACSSFGPDFQQIPAENTVSATADTGETVDVRFEIGWWEEGFGLPVAVIRSLVKQIRVYVDRGHGATDRPFIMFGQSGQATLGLYVGQSLLNQDIGDSALRILQNSLDKLNVSTPQLAMQLCGPGYDSTHIFGVVVMSNGTFAPIQDAIKGWTNATCLPFTGSITFPSNVKFSSPPLHANNTLQHHNATQPNFNLHSRVLQPRSRALQKRADCRTVQVEAGNGCAELAVKCGITPFNFDRLNPGICGSLRPKQHVCCTEGTLPDFRPKPKADGSCFDYSVKPDDNCANLAAEYSLTVAQIESFNKNTWGWNGCQLLWVGTKMCLSTGTAPFPAPVANAVCGPQKPGSTRPADGSNIANLNPCPLRSCCNIWGQCGVSKDFCVDTRGSGAPGTAAPGTHGCISNCGDGIIRGTGTGAIKIAYFQGYGLSRPCLYQDPLQIDTAKYTHIHFGFGTLTPDYDVEVGDILGQYQFREFKRLRNVKRILSFGGWTFSTHPSTYLIFRNGVKPANRLRMATNIANFIIKHNLDGVDIDWEYPGAPDLPDFDPGKAEDGPNYLAFLAILKHLLPGRSTAIAAPASYWYLKQFPIQQISSVVDYIVYMTYDLHGQWDAGSRWSQEGCPTGNCLRSQTNMKETMQSLAMITKAGVPGHKIVVGVTSYGRSFQMSQPGCWGPGCHFTGDRLTSYATPGRCTGTSGYIADAEINEIINSGSNRVVARFVDSPSNSDILVYDNDQWVSYMSDATKRLRAAVYTALGMGGTTDWASDLQVFNDAPSPSESWTGPSGHITMLSAGLDPKLNGSDMTPPGRWKTYDCTHPVITNLHTIGTPSYRWHALDTDTAWKEGIKLYKEIFRPQEFMLMEAFEEIFHLGASIKCTNFLKTGDNCDNAVECSSGLDGPKSGPAAKLIFDALIYIHQMHHDLHTSLMDVNALLGSSVDSMHDTFAPIPPPEDNDKWLKVLIDLLSFGTMTVAAPFFNSFLRTMPYFTPREGLLNNAKDVTMGMIGTTASVTKELLPSTGEGGWTPKHQNKFSKYLAEVVDGWSRAAENSLIHYFGLAPTDAALDQLWSLIKDGQLSEGALPNGVKRLEPMSATELRDRVAKTIFGFGIPTLWRFSRSYAFILDSGADCNAHRPVSEYLSDSTMDRAGVCVNGRKYYLVMPDPSKDNVYECWGEGACEWAKFVLPPGISSLSEYGGVTKEDLVIGSVNTWVANGRRNRADPLAGSPNIIDTNVQRDLFDLNIRIPGFMKLPVCSPERARQTWDTSSSHGSSVNWPCDVPLGRSHCGDSTFEDQTNGGSPLVSDCLQIIRNIEDDGRTDWIHQVAGKPHREILSFGSCQFGIEATHIGLNIHFKVGGQDVIDIINDSVNRFGSSGRVAAKGVMGCTGSTNGQEVLWGIY